MEGGFFWTLPEQPDGQTNIKQHNWRVLIERYICNQGDFMPGLNLLVTLKERFLSYKTNLPNSNHDVMSFSDGNLVNFVLYDLFFVLIEGRILLTEFQTQFPDLLDQVSLKFDNIQGTINNRRLDYQNNLISTEGETDDHLSDRLNRISHEREMVTNIVTHQPSIRNALWDQDALNTWLSSEWADTLRNQVSRQFRTTHCSENKIYDTVPTGETTDDFKPEEIYLRPHTPDLTRAINPGNSFPDDDPMRTILTRPQCWTLDGIEMLGTSGSLNQFTFGKMRLEDSIWPDQVLQSSGESRQLTKQEPFFVNPGQVDILLRLESNRRRNVFRTDLQQRRIGQPPLSEEEQIQQNIADTEREGRYVLDGPLHKNLGFTPFHLTFTLCLTRLWRALLLTRYPWNPEENTGWNTNEAPYLWPFRETDLPPIPFLLDSLVDYEFNKIKDNEPPLEPDLANLETLLDQADQIYQQWAELEPTLQPGISPSPEIITLQRNGICLIIETMTGLPSPYQDTDGVYDQLESDDSSEDSPDKFHMNRFNVLLCLLLLVINRSPYNNPEILPVMSRFIESTVGDITQMFGGAGSISNCTQLGLDSTQRLLQQTSQEIPAEIKCWVFAVGWVPTPTTQLRSTHHPDQEDSPDDSELLHPDYRDIPLLPKWDEVLGFSKISVDSLRQQLTSLGDGGNDPDSRIRAKLQKTLELATEYQTYHSTLYQQIIPDFIRQHRPSPQQGTLSTV